MTTVPTLAKTACALIALAGAVATPALSQKMTNEGMSSSDPLMRMADQPRDEFHLTGSRDVELVRFKQSHLLSICVARADPAQAGAARRAYPLKASFDGDTAVIEPGNCLSFEAMRVKVSPATSIPPNVDLSGTVRVIR